MDPPEEDTVSEAWECDGVTYSRLISHPTFHAPALYTTSVLYLCSCSTFDVPWTVAIYFAPSLAYICQLCLFILAFEGNPAAHPVLAHLCEALLTQQITNH